MNLCRKNEHLCFKKPFSENKNDRFHSNIVRNTFIKILTSLFILVSKTHSTSFQKFAFNQISGFYDKFRTMRADRSYSICHYQQYYSKQKFYTTGPPVFEYKDSGNTPRFRVYKFATEALSTHCWMYPDQPDPVTARRYSLFCPLFGAHPTETNKLRVNFYILEAVVVPCDTDPTRYNFEVDIPFQTASSSFDSILHQDMMKCGPTMYDRRPTTSWRNSNLASGTYFSIPYFTANVDSNLIEILVMTMSYFYPNIDYRGINIAIQDSIAQGI